MVKNRMIKETVCKWYDILLMLMAVFVLTPFVLTPLECLAHTADSPDISPLIAGKNIVVGEISIWNNDENLYVKYQTNDPWYMTGTHLYAGKDLPAAPIRPGLFPYKYPEDEQGVNGFSEYTYAISLSELDVQTEEWVYILAHAVVKNIDTGVEETAWKEGSPIKQPGGGWAMYNTYQIQKLPWVEVSISESELIWDIFKPGRYMSLGPVLRVASNAAVAILYGTGGSNSALGPAVRESSLLPKAASNWGTPDDEIRLWATCLWGTPSNPHAGDPELVPSPGCISTNPDDLFSYWIDFIHLNGYQMQLPESEQLKEGIAFSCYNMINADPCNSQGNYSEQFVITIFTEL